MRAIARAGCKAARCRVLGRPDTSTSVEAPCVLASLAFRSAQAGAHHLEWHCVPRAERSAEVVWEGSSAKGRGSLTAASSGAFAGLPYSEPTRIADPQGETSPEELIAAAHAGCYSMSLAAELTKLRLPPDRLDVRATVVIDQVESGDHRIVESILDIRGRVPGADAGTFERAVELAHEGCPVSSLVRASAQVTLNPTLEGA
jgi:osmotically inducible protein OsmC